MGDTISDANRLTAPHFVNPNILSQVAPFQHLFFVPGHSPLHLFLPHPPPPKIPYHNSFSSMNKTKT